MTVKRGYYGVIDKSLRSEGKHMSDGIFNNGFIERESRRRAWHRLGFVFPADRYIEPSEAMIEVKGNYEIELWPATYSSNGRVVEGKGFGIIRVDPDGTVENIGQATSSFHPLQNMTIARAFDPLAVHYKLETAGILRHGKRMFFTFRLPDTGIMVNGKPDALEQYLLITDSKEPGEAFTIALTTTRVVCENTLMAVLSNRSNFKLPIWHDKAAESTVVSVADTLDQIARNRASEITAMQQLADTELTPSEADSVFEAAFRAPNSRFLRTLDSIAGKDLEANSVGAELIELSPAIQDIFTKSAKTKEYQAERAADQRELAGVSLREMADGQGLGINGWTVLQAVIETEEHRRNGRGNVAYDMAFGTRRDNVGRAVKAVCEIAGIDFSSN